MIPIPACTSVVAGKRPLRVLVMDDEVERVDSYRRCLYDRDKSDVVHCPSSDAAAHNLKSHPYDIVFLDHDLELSALYWGIEGHGSGTELVEWLLRLGPVRWIETLFVVHSLNRTHGRDMAHDLQRNGFHATRRAYAWLDTRDLQTLVNQWTWATDRQRWDVSWPPQLSSTLSAEDDGR